jgi:hypothetical protein
MILIRTDIIYGLNLRTNTCIPATENFKSFAFTISQTKNPHFEWDGGASTTFRLPSLLAPLLLSLLIPNRLALLVIMAAIQAAVTAKGEEAADAGSDGPLAARSFTGAAVPPLASFE